ALLGAPATAGGEAPLEPDPGRAGVGKHERQRSWRRSAASARPLPLFREGADRRSRGARARDPAVERRAAARLRYDGSAGPRPAARPAAAPPPLGRAA